MGTYWTNEGYLIKTIALRKESLFPALMSCYHFQQCPVNRARYRCKQYKLWDICIFSRLVYLSQVDPKCLMQIVQFLGYNSSERTGGIATFRVPAQRRIQNCCNIQDEVLWKPLTIITKRSFLDVAAALDPLLPTGNEEWSNNWRKIIINVVT